MTQEKSTKLILNNQYVKDLSFENPNSPMSISKIANNPQINFNIDINAGKLNDTSYEVVLTISADAKDKEDEKFLIFLTELKFAGLFTVKAESSDEEELKRILLIDCPTLLFPFARRIIADTTREGGFPPLMMEPINFADLYSQNTKH